MDANKLAKLREVRYALLPCCGFCKHGEFRSIGEGFGTCAVTTYEHEKHTGPPRQLSVFKMGSCPLYERSVEKTLALGTAWEEFLKARLDTGLLDPEVKP